MNLHLFGKTYEQIKTSIDHEKTKLLFSMDYKYNDCLTLYIFSFEMTWTAESAETKTLIFHQNADRHLEKRVAPKNTQEVSTSW